MKRKIIDMMTREPLKELAFDKETAENLIRYLLKYQDGPVAEFDHNERYMVHKVISFIEGASGVNTMEILEKKGA